MTENDDVCGFPATNGPCQNPPTGDDGYCWLATHADDPADSEPDGRGAPEGNNNAVDVAAWAEDYVTDFLRDDEIDRVKDFADIAGEPESAQEAAAYAAGLALEQFRRTGDERFLRRYESIMETFNLAPTDEMDLNVDADHSFDATEGVTAEFVTYESEGDDGDE